MSSSIDNDFFLCVTRTGKMSCDSKLLLAKQVKEG